MGEGYRQTPRQVLTLIAFNDYGKTVDTISSGWRFGFYNLILLLYETAGLPSKFPLDLHIK